MGGGRIMTKGGRDPRDRLRSVDGPKRDVMRRQPWERRFVRPPAWPCSDQRPVVCSLAGWCRGAAQGDDAVDRRSMRNMETMRGRQDQLTVAQNTNPQSKQTPMKRKAPWLHCTEGLSWGSSFGSVGCAQSQGKKNWQRFLETMDRGVVGGSRQ